MPSLVLPDGAIHATPALAFTLDRPIEPDAAATADLPPSSALPMNDATQRSRA
jgi:hypothetical protein